MSNTSFQLNVQRRDEQGNLIRETATIEPEKTVAFVIDMWDYHPDVTFLERAKNMIPRFNQTLRALRKLGIQVVHAPADGIETKDPMPPRKVRQPNWAEVPQRKAVLAIPPQEAPPKIPYEPPMPPWHYTGTCECSPDLPCRKKGLPWDTQKWNVTANKDVELAENDLIGDANNETEAINILVSRGYDTIIYLGIASNMCLAQYRMFGLHHTRRRGYRVFFISDAVEAITGNGYDADLEAPDPDLFPAKGSAIVQRHLEKYGGPSFLSRQLIQFADMGQFDQDEFSDDNLHGKFLNPPNPLFQRVNEMLSFQNGNGSISPFSKGGKGDLRHKQKHIVFVIAEDSCDTQQTLPAFAKEYLDEKFRCTFCYATPKRKNSINDLDALYDADLLVLSMERRFLPAWQMDRLGRFIFDADRPMVAIRPSVVAFADELGRKSAGRGRVIWSNFNRELLGCNFLGTCKSNSETGFVIKPIPQYLSHPIMNGLEGIRLNTKNPLYRVMPISLTATPLLMSERQGVESDQIVAWTNISYDSRVFYTSLGCPDDFGNPIFQHLLLNAIHWAVE
jgi:nicotinamidase-related amidase